MATIKGQSISSIHCNIPVLIHPLNLDLYPELSMFIFATFYLLNNFIQSIKMNLKNITFFLLYYNPTFLKLLKIVLFEKNINKVKQSICKLFLFSFDTGKKTIYELYLDKFIVIISLKFA